MLAPSILCTGELWNDFTTYIVALLAGIMLACVAHLPIRRHDPMWTLTDRFEVAV
jgi:hypothetical protein